MTKDTDKLKNAARIAILDCMAVKPDEKLLVVTDDKLRDIGELIYGVGVELGINTAMTLMPPLASHGADAPEHVEAAMKAADAVIVPTSTSLTHTGSRRRACAEGARVATMPNISPETLVRGLNADYEAIAERTIRITEMLTKADLAVAKTALGTDIRIPIKGIKAIASTGLIREKGSFGNLPSGEAYMMPVEGEAEGIIVVDGSMAGVGAMPPGETIRMIVEKGYVTAIEGGEMARKLEKLLEPFGKDGRNLAELGVGTNDSARICGDILEDEKVMGTIHLAVGNNASMGGTITVKIHLDGIINNPDLLIDGKPLLLNGKMLLD